MARYRNTNTNTLTAPKSKKQHKAPASAPVAPKPEKAAQAVVEAPAPAPAPTPRLTPPSAPAPSVAYKPEEASAVFASLNPQAPAPAPTSRSRRRKGPMDHMPISETAKQIAEKDQSMAEKVLGMTLRENDQFFVNGTQLLDVGKEALKKMRQKYEAMPRVHDATQELIETVAAEKREDYKTNTRNLYLDRDGALRDSSRPDIRFVMNDRAYQHLAQMATVEGRFLPYNINAWAKHMDKEISLRTRATPEEGIQAVYAAVTPTYQAFDVNEVASRLAEVMPEDARANISYDGNRYSISAELAPEANINEAGVGQVHRVRVVLTGADDKTAAIRAQYQVVRIQCINCTTITDKKFIFRAKHVKNVKNVFQMAMENVQAAFEAYAAHWNEAAETRLVDPKGNPLDAPEALARVIGSRQIVVPRVRPYDLHQMAVQAWEKEPVHTRAGVINAITRMAHENVDQWRSPWVVQDLEEVAGNILFQTTPNWFKSLTAKQEAKVYLLEAE